MTRADLRRRIRRWAEDRPVVVAMVGTGVLGLLAAFISSPAWWIGDNRWEQYDNPARRLAQSFEAWDASRGLGGPREDIWPLVTAPLALLRGLGVPIAITQHIWLAVLLAAGGMGCVMVLRIFRPQLGVEHAIAAFIYQASPFVAMFLLPSNLFSNYVLAPWLLVIVHRGLHSPQPWRWAAAFALVLAAAGNNDLPGIIYAGVHVIVMVAYFVAVERTVRFRFVARWFAMAMSLSVLASAIALTKLWLASSSYAVRLGDTESPFILNSASSWTEVLRGLGNWLAYFQDHTGPIRPGLRPYFTSPLAAAATVAVPVVAFVSLGWVRWRGRALFGAWLMVSGLLMVGAFPNRDPAPYGRFLLEGYETSQAVDVIRNTSKAGAGLVLGLSGLVGVAVATAWHHIRDRWSWPGRLGAVALVGLVLLGISTPFWSGTLFKEDWRLRQVPAYVEEAMAWIDEQPSAGRVLFLPRSWRNGFRWGWINDDILDSSLRRRHVTETAVPLSAPIGTDAIRALDGALDDRHLVGSPVEQLRRLGVDHVVIRNDIRWEIFGQPRPAEFAQLREDPGLELVATFGDPGQNVVSPDLDDANGYESNLPPIEVYEVRGSPGRVRAEVGPPVLVGGDGDAIPALDRASLLEQLGPVRYIAGLDDEGLLEALDRGSGVVLTDTNRRRSSAITLQTELTETLPAGVEGARSVPDLFDRPSAQTVVNYGRAATITGTGQVRPLQYGGFVPAFRPAAAFDGDPRTAWVAGQGEDAEGRRLDVHLREPAEIDHVVVTAGTPLNIGDRVREVRVRFDGRPGLDVRVEQGVGELSFSPLTVTDIQIEITEVGAGLGAVGLTDVDLGIDLVETVVLPRDLAERAERDGSIARAVAAAPMRVLIERSLGRAILDEEVAVRRTFELSDPRSFSVRATVGSYGRPAWEEAAPGCQEGVITVDGEDVPVREVAREREVIVLEGCDPVDLSAGAHELVAAGSVIIDSILLDDGGWADEAEVGRAQVRIVEDRPSRITVDVDLPAPGTLIAGQSYDADWDGSAEDVDVGKVRMSDGLSGWDLPAGRHRVVMSYGPASGFELSVLVAFLGTVLCIGLLLWSAPGRVRQVSGAAGATVAHRRGSASGLTASSVVAALTFGVLAGGAPGVVVSAAALTTVRVAQSASFGARCAAPVLCVTGGVLAITAGPPDLSYAVDRGAVSVLGMCAAVAASTTVIAFWRTDRAHGPASTEPLMLPARVLVRRVIPVVALAALAVALAWHFGEVLAPDRSAIRSVEAAAGLLDAAGRRTAEPPLSIIVAGISPFGLRMAAGLAALVATAGVGLAAHRGAVVSPRLAMVLAVSCPATWLFGLTGALVSALLAVGMAIRTPDARARPAGQGVVGGLLLVTSPIVGLAVTAWVLLHDRGRRTTWAARLAGLALPPLLWARWSLTGDRPIPDLTSATLAGGAAVLVAAAWWWGAGRLIRRRRAA